MKAIEILEREHRTVRKLLDCLGALRGEAEMTGTLDHEAATALLRLLERFVDWNHQDKEELCLFPYMLTHVTGEEAEYLERVFNEHAQERRRLIGMYMHLHGASAGKRASLDRFVLNAEIYQRLQEAHIEAEERGVLPLARAVLSPADDRGILRGFRRLDDRLGNDPRIEEQVTELCNRFGLPGFERLEPGARASDGSGSQGRTCGLRNRSAALVGG